MEPIITFRSVRWHHLPRNEHSPTGTFYTSGFEVLASSISQVNWFFSPMTQSRNRGMIQRSTRDQTGHPGFLVAKDPFTVTNVTDGLSEDCEAQRRLIFPKQNKLPDRELGKDRVGIIYRWSFCLCCEETLFKIVATFRWVKK